MVIRTIVHFEIAANNPERLAQFYQEAFGWKVEKAPMPDVEYWLITTGPRGKSIGGGMYRKSRPADGTRNFVNVEDIDQAIRVFHDAGGTEIVEKMEVPGMGWSYIGADPEGNAIALWQANMSTRTPRPRAKPKARRARKSR